MQLGPLTYNACPQNNNATLVLFNEAFGLIKDQVKSILLKAASFEKQGKKREAACLYLQAYKILSLPLYIYLVKYSIDLIINSGECLDENFVTDTYKLDCIRKEFACMNPGIDIDKIMDIFGLTDELIGIGWMAIEEGCVIFEVNPDLI